MSLTQMTLSGGVFILLITVVRALTLHRLPKGAFLALWELAALRLLLPFAIPLSLVGLPAVEGLPLAGTALVSGTVSAGLPAAPELPAAVASAPILPPAWLLGMVLTGAWFTAAYLRARLRFRGSRPDDTPAVRRWLEGVRLRRPLEVRRWADGASPLTYGVLRPVILLPEEMDGAVLPYVLTHELVHIRRFDALAKLLFAAALCVHWFNPLVWAMYVLANRDLELSCDEGVLNALGANARASYALTLIHLEEARSFPLCNHFSKFAIEERIEAIMKYKKSSLLAAALAAVLVLGTTAAFAVAPQGEENPLPGTEALMDDSTLSSYVNPKDGKTYYSFDGGKTWQPLTDEEVSLRFPKSNVEWWTAEEYAAWLEKEKEELQAMLGEKGWTGGRGEFVWTQEIIDETIAMYENILQEIKEGKLYSKSVDGDTDALLISGGAGDIFVREEDGTVTPIDRDKVEAISFVFDGSTPMPEGSVILDKTGVPLDDWDVVSAPERTEEERRQIKIDIESGKIPPFEMPDDPGVTVRFVDQHTNEV